MPQTESIPYQNNAISTNEKQSYFGITQSPGEKRRNYSKQFLRYSSVGCGSIKYIQQYLYQRGKRNLIQSSTESAPLQTYHKRVKIDYWLHLGKQSDIPKCPWIWSECTKTTQTIQARKLTVILFDTENPQKLRKRPRILKSIKISTQKRPISHLR